MPTGPNNLNEGCGHGEHCSRVSILFKGLTTTMQVCGSGDTKAFEFGFLFLFLFFPKGSLESEFSYEIY